jgi:hypothetical protein
MEDTSHHSTVPNPGENSNKISIDNDGSSQLSTANSFNNEISNVLSFWKSFNLFSSRQVWEKTCNEMREMKTSAITARKKLNEMTKSFRSKTKEEQLTGNTISDLLKAYQEEIDSLSRRSKLSESAYVGVYKSLYDAPDPAYYLEQLLATQSSSNSYILEIEKLRNELHQYEEEFQTLKNQEITIRRLEEQLLQYQLNNEITIDDEVNKRTETIRKETDQEIIEIKELNKSIERRLNLGNFFLFLFVFFLSSLLFLFPSFLFPCFASLSDGLLVLLISFGTSKTIRVCCKSCSNQVTRVIESVR